MTEASEEWFSAVEAALAVGQRLGNSSEEFDCICEHIAQLLEDASTLITTGSHATGAFLSITALEETSKAHMGMYRQGAAPVKRSKDSLYKHGEKHRLALGPTVAMGSRLQAAIGEGRMRELIAMAGSGSFVLLREAALYVEQKDGALSIPATCVPRSTARELLLLAVEAFDDALVGYTSRSMELSARADKVFERWADA